MTDGYLNKEEREKKLKAEGEKLEEQIKEWRKKK